MVIVCLLKILECAVISDNEALPDWPKMFYFEEWVGTFCKFLIAQILCLGTAFLYIEMIYPGWISPENILAV